MKKLKHCVANAVINQGNEAAKLVMVFAGFNDQGRATGYSLLYPNLAMRP